MLVEDTGANQTPDQDQAPDQDSVKKLPSDLKKDDVLSFRCVGRILTEDNVEAEFARMLQMLKKPEKPAPTPDDFRRVGMGSGSHLLKIIQKNADRNQCVLRFARSGSNDLPVFVPSLNAGNIPYAKIVYRPLEIRGRAPKSVVDHIRQPDDISEAILTAFAGIFGGDCLDALRDALLGEGQRITSLPAGEFPTIFLPRPGGGDIQATPVSPAGTFTGFRKMSGPWFLKQDKNAPPVPRGRWIKQLISAKPQNISGMIDGRRQRFLAEMPSIMRDHDAAIRRYALGGNFPFWNDDSVEAAVLHYAGRLGMEYTNRDIRTGTDRYADRLIRGALDFIAEVRDDARELLENDGKGESALPRPPDPSALILRRRWKKGDREKATKALTSPHFCDRERITLEKPGA